jgi:putative flavoprotein involved in K+ transport
MRSREEGAQTPGAGDKHTKTAAAFKKSRLAGVILTPMKRTERYELIVIGGGQAGLAIGYWLAQHDIDFLIVDANVRVGDAWRKRWDSLKLFTPAKYSSLPGLAFPGDPYHLPARDEVADYLEWYAQVFELPVRNNVRVKRLTRTARGFEIDTDGTLFESDNVIVATGPFHVPNIPAVSQAIDGSVLQLHSSQYRNPSQLPAGPALVAGAANSGAQIALELAKSRAVLLAGRSVGTMKRRVLGRDVFDWLSLTVMRPGSDSFIGKRIRKNILSSTDALIGMSERDLTNAGVRRGGRVISALDGRPILQGGQFADVASIIWATGFRPDFSWIDAPVFGDDGFPIHHRGLTAVPGLYFLGLRFQHRLNSSLIGGVVRDAEFVAAAVSARYGFTRALGRDISRFVQSAAPLKA